MNDAAATAAGDDDPTLAVSRAMTHEEREAFLARFLKLNRAWEGSTVADVLDALDEVDAHMDVVEPLFRAHGAEVDEPGLLAVAVYAAVYSTATDAHGDDLGTPAALDAVWGRASDIVARVRAGAS